MSLLEALGTLFIVFYVMFDLIAKYYLIKELYVRLSCTRSEHIKYPKGRYVYHTMNMKKWIKWLSVWLMPLSIVLLLISEEIDQRRIKKLYKDDKL